MEREFAKLRASANEEGNALAQRFVEKNPDVEATLEQNDVLFEYVSQHDHLYMTVGAPREGVAFLAGHIVLIADPETLELIAVEVLDFSKAVETDDMLRGWKPLYEFLLMQPVVQIPRRREEDERAPFPEAVAQGIRGVLQPA